MIRKFILFLFAGAMSTSHADVTFTFVDDPENDDRFSLQVDGNPADLPGSLTIELIGGKAFDWTSDANHSPPIGTGSAGNNDGVVSRSLTWEIGAFPYQATGDIDNDGVPDAVLAAIRVNWGDAPAIDLFPDEEQTTAILLFSTTLATGEYTETTYLRWIRPTEYEDGVPLTRAEIEGYEIFMGQDPATLPMSPFKFFVPGDATTAQIPQPLGTWYYAARTLATTTEEPSVLSNTAFNVVTDTDPDPPAVFEVWTPPAGPLVTVDTRVYFSTRLPDANGITRVGDVPLGTECIETEALITAGEVLYVVPADAITYPPEVDARSDVNYARCDVAAAP